ncbi:TadA family conjugal transfer-associated ATPase [Micromonospora sp. NBC_01796]|uniref:TadA family conjugal transfer-associated ATPase n=1 Tax=Micromonospora sp. NBC_01796 TaxID=2975987 RepID=UPI002DD829C8|nr:TadA family conjugal transfer-associated ATPase [Micromonospora sp. NBC_01796]WSA88072.1 TadA family conjugal transfer-associated ATPase [Micromonospora sp. NBC_01796]
MTDRIRVAGPTGSGPADNRPPSAGRGAAAGGPLASRVRRRFATEGTAITPAAVVAAVRDEPGAAVLGDTAVLRMAGQVHDDLVGAGPLAPLLADTEVTDVLVNGVRVWVDRGRGLQPVPVALGTRDDVRRLAQRLAAGCGRRLDEGSPYVDGRLPDGTRLHAVLPPVATDGPYLSLRTFRQRPFTLDELVRHGTVPRPAAGLLAAVVAARLAYLVVGGTGSGKTTLLNTLLGLVPPTERIVLVEDAAELRPVHPHVVGLQARTANVEGTGTVGLSDLVRQALRMRPDRIVVGECRGAEVVDLLAALNTGHDGGAGTLHANAPADVPARLEALGLLGGLPRAALHAQVTAALQVLLQVRRTEAGRVLEAVCLLLPSGPERLVTVVPAWRRGEGAGPAATALARLLTERGVPVPAVLLEPAAPTRPELPARPGLPTRPELPARSGPLARPELPSRPAGGRS